MSSVRSIMSLVFFLIFISLAYTNCSQPSYSVEASSTASSTLTITPANASVAAGSAIQFAASGGTAPYTYSIISGSGTMNSSYGYFVAGSYNDTVVVQAMDSLGSKIQTSVYVSASTTSTVTYTNSSTTSTATTLATVPVYRYYLAGNRTHLFSLSASETTGLEGVGFLVLSSSAVAYTRPLYRCLISGYIIHFISTDGACSGYTFEGTYGYIYTYAASNTAPLYSFFSYLTGSYLATMDYNGAAAAGFTYQGTYGYVPLQ